MTECLADCHPGDESIWMTAYDTGKTVAMGSMVANPIVDYGRCIFEEESCAPIEMSRESGYHLLRASKFMGIKAEVRTQSFNVWKVISTEDIIRPSELLHPTAVQRVLELATHQAYADYRGYLPDDFKVEIETHGTDEYIYFGECQWTAVASLVKGGIRGYRSAIEWTVFDPEGNDYKTKLSAQGAFLWGGSMGFKEDLNYRISNNLQYA